jgi:hypothetical protein
MSNGGRGSAGSANASGGSGGLASAGTASGGTGAAGTDAGGMATGLGGVSAGGAGGTPISSVGGGGTDGDGGTSGGSVTNGGTGGATGTGGTGGSLAAGGSAGAGGAGPGGGGNGGTGGACSPVAWFPDGDGDGYGRSSGQVTACTAPTSGTWVTQGGDCDDDNVAVNPGQTSYEPEGYTTSGSTESFDYDCSGGETVDPTQEGTAPACTNILACSGSGFQPTTRTGSGVNPLCGSKKHVTCASGTLTCMQVVTEVSEGIRCR